jgi:hypothetical protein
VEAFALDKARILDSLSVAATTTIKLTHLDAILWGQGLHFHALAQPLTGDNIAFELRFLDCREMRWQIYTHIQHPDSIAFPATELVNFRIGRSQHRSPANLLTEHFGLSLFYGRIQVVRGEQVIVIN